MEGVGYIDVPGLIAQALEDFFRGLPDLRRQGGVNDGVGLKFAFVRFFGIAPRSSDSTMYQPFKCEKTFTNLSFVFSFVTPLMAKSKSSGEDLAEPLLGRSRRRARMIVPARRHGRKFRRTLLREVLAPRGCCSPVESFFWMSFSVRPSRAFFGCRPRGCCSPAEIVARWFHMIAET